MNYQTAPIVLSISKILHWPCVFKIFYYNYMRIGCFNNENFCMDLRHRLWAVGGKKTIKLNIALFLHKYRSTDINYTAFTPITAILGTKMKAA